MKATVESWARYPVVEHRSMFHPAWTDEARTLLSSNNVLAYGKGRSYGDVCLNGGGDLICTTSWNRLVAFNRTTGLLRAEAGVVLGDLLDIIIPAGWFVPVTPGTRWITLGGALANDIHGKNHHKAGTFGCHVTCFELVRSDGSVRICSPTENVDFFKATIGGLGLTGIVTWIELQLIPIASRNLSQESCRIGNLEDMLKATSDSETNWDYVVSWMDVTSKGRSLGRGHVFRANWCTESDDTLHIRNRDPIASIPFEAPNGLLNYTTISLFNALVYNRQLRAINKSHIDLQPYFYPLDVVANWNKLYGSRGFLQYQCVIPQREDVADILREMLARLHKYRAASFFTVVKNFGSIPSPGMMSFPMPGTTLALDVPNTRAVHTALNECDAVLLQAGGRLYPAKDSRMSGETFRAMYPQWMEFSAFVDPHISSSFWRRVTT